jgi:pimeloyl-ACP methyl ester carboxylesterase
MTTRTVQLSAGPVEVRDSGGDGPAVLFVHGVLVDGSLWRKVVPPLSAAGVRCLVPDLPLGSHRSPMKADADLTPPALAALLVELADALDAGPLTLVGNDTGGALCQIAVASRPDRFASLVLTPCDSFENFFPPMFRPLQALSRVPGGLDLALQPLRIRRLRGLPMAYGLLTKRPVPDEVTDGWLRPFFSDRAIRRDTRKVVRGVDSRHTLDAAARLAAFDRPALIAWAPEDRVFPFDHGERLATILPQARLEPIEDSRSFVPEDQPERLAELIAGFVAA